jgi:hypothetical protein
VSSANVAIGVFSVRIVNKMKESMEGKKVFTSVFLDIQQAFDKV